MSLVRWDASRELEELAARLERAVGRPALPRPSEGGKEALTVPDCVPAVDIAETPEEHLVMVELPEIKKEDVKVTKVTVENVLRIGGERKQEKQEGTRKYDRIEPSYGNFVRTFARPEDVDETHVLADSAEYTEGDVLADAAPRREVVPRAT